jgi:hypothetical protein
MAHGPHPTIFFQDQIEAMTKMPVAPAFGEVATPPRAKRLYDPAPKAKASPAPREAREELAEGEINAAAELRQKLRSRTSPSERHHAVDIDSDDAGFREIADRAPTVSTDLDGEIDDLDAELDDLMGTL